MKPAISVENLGKSYRVSHESGRKGYRTLRESLASIATAPLRRLRCTATDGASSEEFWALKDVNFEVRPGEVVGIIGRNGAGKSTLLKVLSRITKPTHGEIAVSGRVGSLLEVGTGFHPELTGRENIYLNGSILGMSKREISRRFDEIVAFAEVERFLDTPVKRYSSGMYVRLAFSVAAHLNPEVLFIDEVLAVGDASFQKKCLSRMGDVAAEGRTVLFVSHNMAAVKSICTTAYLFSGGRVADAGAVDRVVSAYLSEAGRLVQTPLVERRDRTGRGDVRFCGFRVRGATGNRLGAWTTGEDAMIELDLRTRYELGPRPANLDVAVVLRDQHDAILTTLSSHFTGEGFSELGEALTVVCRLPKVPLLAGRYRVDLWCGISTDTEDHILDAAVIDVDAGNFFNVLTDLRLPDPSRHGPIVIPQSWQRV